jgi:2-hydroxycyclohexanecarboxyl-CoA dehydrogenase
MIGLQDKTVVLAGPFNPLMQNLTARLTQDGASVAVVTDDIKSAGRVCQNLMDMREVSDKYGRTAAIEAQFKDEKAVSNNFSRAAELFGGIDIYIDTYLAGLRIPFFTEKKIGDVTELFQKEFDKSQLMTKVAAQFLKGRNRGRILYLYHELDMWAADKAESHVFIDFIEFVHELAKQLAAQNTAVNALALGVNEEYLLTRFSKSQSIQKSLIELKKSIAHAKLVDYNEIANMTSFLASPASSGVSGQVIRFDHGL